MVAIFYKWILGDGIDVPYEVEEEEMEEEGKNVCLLSRLPLLRQLTEELSQEPAEEDIPKTVEGGI